MAQETEPDLIIFAGDLIDEMKCLDWLDDTLGRCRRRWVVILFLVIMTGIKRFHKFERF